MQKKLVAQVKQKKAKNVKISRQANQNSARVTRKNNKF